MNTIDAKCFNWLDDKLGIARISWLPKSPIRKWGKKGPLGLYLVTSNKSEERVFFEVVNEVKTGEVLHYWDLKSTRNQTKLRIYNEVSGRGKNRKFKRYYPQLESERPDLILSELVKAIDHIIRALISL